MARWKLMTAHYLNLVEPTEWEHSESARNGKSIRKKFIVPRLLDPRDPDAWNSTWGSGADKDGEIIVCRPNKGERNDYAFESDPTPDMVPLDDEAREISAKFEPKWAYKPENADTSYSQSMIDRFESAMAEKAAAPTEVTIAGLDTLVSAMAKQTELLAALMTNQSQTTAVPALRR